ncbi:A/G-specific adenine glycosylase [Candidatus Saccharibacteria bacterium]|nr:A/G-specific adenine glycosylase [Candidatus Saccharibacteria bacterium]
MNSNSSAFVAFLKNWSSRNFRDMPWRREPTGYYVLVSELMLQQTQVERVVPKFLTFINQFNTIDSLASALQSEVVIYWQGLGYNRRALYLHQSAQQILSQHGGMVPSAVEALESLPGVGKNTAGAIAAYVYNMPVIFIETNIRTVLFYHFFKESRESINDRALQSILAQCLAAAIAENFSPREFYWAMMDYGAFLKRSGVKNNYKSVSYRKQSALEGSVRQARGLIIAHLTTQPRGLASYAELIGVSNGYGHTDSALAQLEREGFIVREAAGYRLR